METFVEGFADENFWELEKKINQFAQENNCEIVTLSAYTTNYHMGSTRNHLALVVFKRVSPK